MSVLFTGSRVDGLAVASQSRALYYTDSHQNDIVIMSLDGKHRKVLTSQNLTSPRAIVVDEHSGSVTVTVTALPSSFLSIFFSVFLSVISLFVLFRPRAVRIYTVSQKNCANSFFVITFANFDGL